MKKFFTMAAIAMAAFTANATDYTDELTVTLNGTPISTSESTISVDQNDNGTYLLQLRNFILSAGGSTLPIGNIIVDNVQGFESSDGSTVLTTSQVIAITGGAMDDMLSSVPVDIRGEIREGKLFAIIDIDMMATLGQTINVQFGDGGYQIGNSGFEEFHTATLANPTDPTAPATSDEPDHWHSFMSASSYQADGTQNPVIAYLAGYSPHTFISDSIRPGSTGTQSVLLTSVDLWIAIANGTITTGRLNAGSTTAADLLNHSWNAIDSVGVDDNGDPFYATLNGRPDSLAVWVKFIQGTPNAEHPYATVSAIINDGTYYQDPEDKEYTNVVAKAANPTIETNGGQWQRIVAPFDYATYEENNAEGKVILVTISTNADPGAGSTDSLYVDDFELIYNGEVTGISVKGQAIEEFDPATAEYTVAIDGDDADVTADDITVATNAQGAKVFMDFADAAEAESGNDVTITVMSADLKTSSTYLVKTRSKGFLDGIENVAADSSEVEAIYNLSGQRVENPVKGQVYITKYTDGKTVKTIMK